jgi:hypothetical protein
MTSWYSLSLLDPNDCILFTNSWTIYLIFYFNLSLSRTHPFVRPPARGGGGHWIRYEILNVSEKNNKNVYLKVLEVFVFQPAPLQNL